MKQFISKSLLSQEAEVLSKQLLDLRERMIELEREIKKKGKRPADAVLLAGALKQLKLLKDPIARARAQAQKERAEGAMSKWNEKTKPILESLERALCELQKEVQSLESELSSYVEIEVNDLK